MKTNRNFYPGKPILFIAMLIMLNGALMAQVDTTKTVPADTTKPAPVAMDTAVTAAPPPPPPSTSSSEPKSKQFIIYAGWNSNQLGSSTNNFDVNSGSGWHAGVAWKTPGFIYWQFGARYNDAAYDFASKLTKKDTGSLKVQAIDVPLTLGVNFLRLLRAYVSAVPSFNVGVNDNKMNIKKDDINSFIFIGQVGIGASVAFAMIDVGYNYGFSGLLKNVDKTNPGQVFVSLGVRF